MLAPVIELVRQPRPEDRPAADLAPVAVIYAERGWTAALLRSEFPGEPLFSVRLAAAMDALEAGPVP